MRLCFLAMIVDSVFGAVHHVDTTLRGAVIICSVIEYTYFWIYGLVHNIAHRVWILYIYRYFLRYSVASMVREYPQRDLTFMSKIRIALKTKPKTAASNRKYVDDDALQIFIEVLTSFGYLYLSIILYSDDRNEAHRTQFNHQICEYVRPTQLKNEKYCTYMCTYSIAVFINWNILSMDLFRWMNFMLVWLNVWITFWCLYHMYIWYGE